MPSLPTSYSSLPLNAIKITHVPPSSPTPTPVLLVTLNRPKAFNAATSEMITELLTAYELFGADDRVKAIVLTGAGPAFCVGADLSVGFGDVVKELKSDASGREVDEYRDLGGIITRTLHTSPKPTITAINGPAVGFGITLTLASTIRIASRTAKISFPFTRLGLSPEACSSFFLPRIVGLGRALHLLATGETYPADHKLLELLFSEVVGSGQEAVERALEVAGNLAKTSVVSSAVVRDLVDRGLGLGLKFEGQGQRGEGEGVLEKVHRDESRAFAGLLMGEDSWEGMRAFGEKRAPVFKERIGQEGSGLVAVGWRGRGSKI